jgi:hypothetical protein
MPHFVAAVGGGVANAAQYFYRKFNPDQRMVDVQVAKALNAPNTPYGKDLPAGVWLQMSDSTPKLNRFYDLALMPDPAMLLVSERVKTYLEERNFLKGNEVLRVALRDPKDRPLDDVYLVRQLVTPACIDDNKSKGTLFPGESEYQFMSKIVLDPTRVPDEIHLFRAAQYPTVLFITETLARAFVDAGFVGLDYLAPEKWSLIGGPFTDPELQGPRPVAVPTKAPKKMAKRRVPTALAPLLEAHRNQWIEIVHKGPCRGMRAFVFNWDAAKPSERKALEEDFLFDSPLEEPQYVPFAVLHTNLEWLAEEIGKKPKSLADAIGAQFDGLLMSDAMGCVIFLESGSRTDIVPLVQDLKIKTAH